MRIISSQKRWLLGYTKGSFSEPIYLYDFSWDCDWYWSGGWLGNHNSHFHFNGCFLEVPDVRGYPLGNFTTPSNAKEGSIILRNGCAIWEDVEVFLNDVPKHISSNWWRIKDLFKQFYTLRDAAEVFQYGGHCTTKGRKPDEINKEFARKINEHIETVIIREIRSIFNQED